MKTFSDFILEARGEHAEEIAKLRRQAQDAMRRGDMNKYTELAQDIKQLQSAENVEREIHSNAPKHKSTQPTPGGGRPQKKEDVISSVGTRPDGERSSVHDLRTGERLGPEQPSDVRTAGLYGNRRGKTGSGHTGQASSGGQMGRNR